MVELSTSLLDRTTVKLAENSLQPKTKVSSSFDAAKTVKLAANLLQQKGQFISSEKRSSKQQFRCNIKRLTIAAILPQHKTVKLAAIKLQRKLS